MISTVPNGSYSTQPRPGSWGSSSSRYLRRVHLRTRLAAYFASAAVVATSAMNASAGLRSRSSASAFAIASSFSSISFASCSNCRLRQSMSRVRPVAKVWRSRATVAGMSTGLAAAPFVDSDVFGATDSVVIIVLPEQGRPPRRGRPLIGDNRDPNHPVGSAVGRIRPDENSGVRLQELFGADADGYVPRVIGGARHLQPLRNHKVGKCVLVVGERDVLEPAAQPAHLVRRALGAGAPAVVVEPLRDVRAVVVAVHQLTDVDGLLQAELVGHLPEPLAHLLASLLGVRGRGFGRDPASRRAQLADQSEQPVLRLRGQVHQQTLSQPRGPRRRVEAGGPQRGRPVLTQVDGHGAAFGR